MNPLSLRESLPQSLLLLDRGGVFMRRVAREDAFEILRSGDAILLRRSNADRPHAIRLIEPDMTKYESGRRRGNKYSHCHETGTNPDGVWTLVPVPAATRPAFSAVLAECGASWMLRRKKAV